LEKEKSKLIDQSNLLSEQIRKLSEAPVQITENDVSQIFSFVLNQLGENNEISSPKVRLISRDEYARELQSSLEKDKPKEEDVETFRIFLQTFGYLPKSYTNQQILDELVASQVGLPSAFYSPENKELTLIKDISRSRIYYRYNLAHELTHYVQDVRLDLKQLKKKHLEGSTDKYLAFMALIEGQASYVAQQYVLQLSSAEKQELQIAISRASTDTSTSKVTRYDRVKNEFVYGSGLGYIQQTQKFKTTDIAQALEGITSSHILNPQQSIKTKPTSLTLSLPGYTSFEKDMIGESGCRLLLHTLSDAHSTCSGWVNDEYTLLRKDDQVIVLVAFRWDSAVKAQLFEKKISESQKQLENNFSTSVSGNTTIVLISLSEKTVPAQELEKVTIWQ
jgi:Zn-dependent peptidase ImmA (M78 family)